jgi:hypothetical protein
MSRSFPFHPELQAQFQQSHASAQQRRVSLQPNVRMGRDTNQVSGLRVFLWGLFQPPLRGPNTAVTLIYEDKNVVLVFCLEFGKNWVAGVLLSGCKEFSLQPFGM